MKFFEKERERKAFFQKSFLSQKLIKLTYLISTEVMACDEDVVVLVDLFVGVNVAAAEFVALKESGFEIVALNEDVVVLVDAAVVVNVAENRAGFGIGNGIRLGIDRRAFVVHGEIRFADVSIVIPIKRRIVKLPNILSMSAPIEAAAPSAAPAPPMSDPMN